MKLVSVWREKMRFTTEVDGHSVPMDSKSPVGDDTAITPKQMLVSAICGRTGMDVVALLKKYRQPLDKFEIEAEALVTEGEYPKEKVLEAVTLSQTKYCSVSAMLSKGAL